MITVSMRWEPNLSVNARYIPGDRPRLRPEVLDWQMELASEIKSSIDTLDIELGPQVIVDVEIFSHRKRVPDNYLKSIMDGVGAGTGIADSNLIPFIRSMSCVDEGAAGFLIRVYPANLAGHGLTGVIEQQPGPTGRMIIALDDDLPVETIGSRVKINVGVICNA